ncbi:MAG: amidohydrolase family protein [Longimicrobiales bacterium]
MASVIAAGFIVIAASTARAQTVAITNARIHTIAGPALERGTIVVRDGRIEAVGASVSPPAGIRVIDGNGLTVTPGFLDSYTSLGIVEIGAVDGTNDAATTLDRFTAAFNVMDAINPLASTIPVTRVAGITRAIVAPGNGSSLIAGQSVLISLAGQRVTDMVLRSPTAVHVTLGEAGSAMAGGSRAAAIMELREAFADARDFQQNREAWQENRHRDYVLSRLDLEALQPVLTGDVPLAVTVHRASDILTTLRLAEEVGIRVILVGASEAWMVADAIAAASVPVIINPLTNIPGFQSMGITFENAARLHAAGVTVVFASFDAHNARNLKQFAGNAVSYGLPYDAALAAVTTNPARVWGIDSTYGTIEPGMDADLVVWSGDPFELLTEVVHVFIRGEEVDPHTRQTELLEKYRTIR